MPGRKRRVPKIPQKQPRQSHGTTARHHGIPEAASAVATAAVTARNGITASHGSSHGSLRQPDRPLSFY